MEKEFKSYIDKVVGSIGVGGEKRKKIKEDLYATLIEKQEITGEDNPYILLGAPEEVAEEFRQNLGVIREEKAYLKYRRGYEYSSKIKLFGVPLVHVNTKPFGVAKGIFAFGSIAIGLFSLGGIAIGMISLGGFALALLMSCGGMALSGGLALGGIALAYGASMGGIAVAKYIAIGGIARANIAIGGWAKGVVAVFNQQGYGKYIFQIPVNADEVIRVIKEIYPNIGDSVLDLLKFFIIHAKS